MTVPIRRICGINISSLVFINGGLFNSILTKIMATIKHIIMHSIHIWKSSKYRPKYRKYDLTGAQGALKFAEFLAPILC